MTQYANQDNPYKSPESPINLPQQTYSDPRPRGKLVINAFYAVLLSHIVYILIQLLRLPTFHEFIETGSNISTLEKGDLLEAGWAVFMLVAQVILIVIFLMWVHRTYKNLKQLQADGLTTSPRWAVGWYFIPFANLYQPYALMTETWKASATQYPEKDNPLSWQQLSGSRLIIIWWWLYLLSSISQRIITKKQTNAESLEELIALMPYDLIASCLTILGCWYGIKVVKAIGERQHQRHISLQQQDNEII